MASASAIPILNYKKYEKKMREIQQLKLKKNCSKEEKEKISMESFYITQLEEKNKKQFNNLPDDVIYIILSYLPSKERLNMLRKKYSHSFLTSKLSMLPTSIATFFRLQKCVKFAITILYSVSQTSDDNNWKLCHQVFGIKKRCAKGHHYSKKDYFAIRNDFNLSYDIKNSIDIILKAMNLYTKMYKNKQNVVAHGTNERIMLEIFIQTLIICSK